MAIPSQEMQKEKDKKDFIITDDIALKNRLDLDKEFQKHYKKRLKEKGPNLKASTKRDIHLFSNKIYFQLKQEFINKIFINSLIIQRWNHLEKDQTIIREILHRKQISEGETKLKIFKQILEKNFKKYEKLIGKNVQEEIKASIDKSKQSASNKIQKTSLWSNIRQGVKDSHKKVLEELSKKKKKEIHDSLKNKK